MNQVVIIGRLVRDVELKFTPGQGKAIATGTVAVNRRIPKDKTDFINVQQWGAPAEKYFAQYGEKGRLIAVRGELNIDKWKDNDGKVYPKTEQVARCGNAVPPPFAEALARSNLPELCEETESERRIG